MVLMIGAMSIAWFPAPGVAQSSGVAQTGDPLRVEWQSRDLGNGHTLISGYVYNQRELRVERVQLRVEPASGGSGGSRVVYVNGAIPGQGRQFFEAKMPAANAPYRVIVGMFDFSMCGNG
jgi:hypothetical protein